MVLRFSVKVRVSIDLMWAEEYRSTSRCQIISSFLCLSNEFLISEVLIQYFGVSLLCFLFYSLLSFLILVPTTYKLVPIFVLYCFDFIFCSHGRKPHCVCVSVVMDLKLIVHDIIPFGSLIMQL